MGFRPPPPFNISVLFFKDVEFLTWSLTLQMVMNSSNPTVKMISMTIPDLVISNNKQTNKSHGTYFTNWLFANSCTQNKYYTLNIYNLSWLIVNDRDKTHWGIPYFQVRKVELRDKAFWLANQGLRAQNKKYDNWPTTYSAKGRSAA